MTTDDRPDLFCPPAPYNYGGCVPTGKPRSTADLFDTLNVFAEAFRREANPSAGRRIKLSVIEVRDATQQAS